MNTHTNTRSKGGVAQREEMPPVFLPNAASRVDMEEDSPSRRDAEKKAVEDRMRRAEFKENENWAMLAVKWWEKWKLYQCVLYVRF